MTRLTRSKDSAPEASQTIRHPISTSRYTIRMSSLSINLVKILRCPSMRLDRSKQLISMTRGSTWNWTSILTRSLSLRGPCNTESSIASMNSTTSNSQIDFPIWISGTKLGLFMGSKTRDLRLRVAPPTFAQAWKVMRSKNLRADYRVKFRV